MNLIEPILLGIIQGITEWLPVSSEGISSLVMMNFFGKSLSESVFLSIWLHTGTLLAALIYFRKDVWNLVKNLPKYSFRGNEYNDLTTFLIISTLFTGLVGAPLLLLGLEKIEISLNFAMVLIGIFLIITGLVQKFGKKKKGLKRNPKINDSVIVGLIQGFAVLPGLSRSGLTISALLFRKYEAKSALKLSFLMSIPAVLVAEVGLGLLGRINFNTYSLVAISFSFIFGLATIEALMKVARKIDFSWFCLILGFLAVMSLFL